MIYLLVVLVVFAYLFISGDSARAAIPNSARIIPFQGVLTNSSGNYVADGNYDMVFSIYSVASAGTALWSTTHSGVNAVAVTNGAFSVNIGSLDANGVNIALDTPPYYLGIKVGTNAEMTPRIQLGFSPFAMTSKNLSNVYTDAAGNVGIGTTGPQGQFDISGRYVIHTKTTTVNVAVAAANISLGSYDVGSPLWIDVNDSGCNGGGGASYYLASGYNTAPTIYTFGDNKGYPNLDSKLTFYYKQDANLALQYLYLQVAAFGCTDPNNHTIKTVVKAAGPYTPGSDPGFTAFTAVTKYINPAGSGASGYLAKWTGGNALANSVVYDNGTNVGIGTTGPGAKLDVAGSIRAGQSGTVSGVNSFTISSLNGDADEIYILELQGDLTTTADRYIYITPNNDTTGTYFSHQHRIDASASNIAEVFSALQGIMIGRSVYSTNGTLSIQSKIYAKSGFRRQAVSSAVFYASQTQNGSSNIQGTWANTTSNITSLVVNFNGGTFTGNWWIYALR